MQQNGDFKEHDYVAKQAEIEGELNK